MSSWTPRRAAATSRRNIKSLRAAITKHLGAVAHQWGDEDSFIEGSADDLIRDFGWRLDALLADIDETVNARESESCA